MTVQIRLAKWEINALMESLRIAAEDGSIEPFCGTDQVNKLIDKLKRARKRDSKEKINATPV